MQVVVAEVVAIELQQGFLGLLAEPKDRPFDHLIGPFDVAQDPGGCDAGQFGGRSVVENERSARVLAEEAWPARARSLAPRPHRGRYAPCVRRRPAGLSAGRQRSWPMPIVSAWTGTLSSWKKSLGRVLTRHQIERDQPRAAVADGERLVEGDVAVAADAQQKHVDPAGLENPVPRTAGNVRRFARGGVVPSRIWMFSGRTFTWSKNVSCIQRW